MLLKVELLNGNMWRAFCNRKWCQQEHKKCTNDLYAMKTSKCIISYEKSLMHFGDVYFYTIALFLRHDIQNNGICSGTKVIMSLYVTDILSKKAISGKAKLSLTSSEKGNNNCSWQGNEIQDTQKKKERLKKSYICFKINLSC